MHLNRDEFGSWLVRYVEAWRSGDAAIIGDLFSADATYDYRVGSRVVMGRDAIVAAWLAEDETTAWDAHYEPLAIDDEVHVSIGWSRYFDDSGALRDEYSNIFLCRFDEDGRCREFTEWWMRAPNDGPLARLGDESA